jgi:hypothetical protein
MAARAAHAVTRSMTTERQNAKETAARPAHAVTRSIMAERQDAKEMAARAAHAVTRSIMAERHDAKEVARPAHGVPRLMTAEHSERERDGRSSRPCGDAIDDDGAPGRERDGRSTRPCGDAIDDDGAPERERDGRSSRPCGDATDDGGAPGRERDGGSTRPCGDAIDDDGAPGHEGIGHSNAPADRTETLHLDESDRIRCPFIAACYFLMDRTIPSRTMTVRAKQAFGSDPRLCYRTAVPAHTPLSTKPTSAGGTSPRPPSGELWLTP